MKKVFLAFLMAIFLSSCGGVIGNIEKYRFPDHTTDEVKSAVQKVYTKHPELISLDTTKYKDRQSTLLDGFYYITTQENNKMYILKYAYQALVPGYDTTTTISLVSAGISGEGLRLAKNIGYFKKRKYRKLFEHHFIDEVNNELKK